jgi:cytochrome P450
MYSSSTDGHTSEITPEWCANHFDHISPALADNLNGTLDYMREHHPVAHSEEYGGFWVVTRYEDVLRVAQDWRTFSNAGGVTVPPVKPVVPSLPLDVDPPLHTIYKRLINAYFTPAYVSRYEERTRALVTRLIDQFIEAGECEFMGAFARPFPGMAFFEMALNASSDDVARLNELSMAASIPTHPKNREGWEGLVEWIRAFVEERRREQPRDDIVDAIVSTEIDGRPITDTEIVGLIQLIILGGLDTTAGALGHFFIRFSHEPEIPALLREKPEIIPNAIEELLRLEGPFLCIGRTATRDADVGGQTIKAGEKVIIYWAAADRDEAEFACPAKFDPERKSNRHLAFGAGPHRCAGSNLARMNLRISLEELTQRLDHVKVQEGPPIHFHSAFNRAPLAVPITFTPGPRVGAETAGVASA